MSKRPSEEYRQRLSAREALARGHEASHRRLGTIRLLLAAGIVVLAWFAFYARAVSAWWLLVPLAAFVAVVSYHYTVRRAWQRAERAVGFYQRGLARIEDRWSGTGATGERFDEPHHVYASDLDLFGKGSLFQLLSSARTRMGEETLASWLLNPASIQTVRERHVSIADLRERIDLREDVGVLGGSSSAGVKPEALLAWAETPNSLSSAPAYWAALLLPVLAIVGAIIWNVWTIRTPFLLVIAIEAVVLSAFAARLKQVLQGTEAAFEDLKLFAAVLTRIEAEPFQAEPLKQIVARLSSHTKTASRTIASLANVVGFMEARRNPILAVLSVPLMYPLNTALGAERWRKAHGAAVRQWVSAVGEIEALLSIAAYSYEHPDDPLPEIVEGTPRFEGTGLGHPLLAAAHCVRNDASIGGTARVLLVSGSNMSGKSTLLRTVGINTVLAMAGAPVRAARLQLTPLQVGASIRINDSLHEGSSRFYAEITRLRQLLELTNGPIPLLFLLDELLQGTNSNDRRIGAEGIVKAFVERQAIGLISTHDLALTHIGGLDAGSLHNVHFQDEIQNGRMKFDFTLREGVVTKSNGVELMRSVGLDV